MFETEYLLMLRTLQPPFIQGLFPLAPKRSKTVSLFKTRFVKIHRNTHCSNDPWMNENSVFTRCEPWVLCFWHKLVEGHSCDHHVLTVFNTAPKIEPRMGKYTPKHNQICSWRRDRNIETNRFWIQLQRKFRREYWSGLPFPSPGDLPDPGIEPRSPALQADPLTSEPPGKRAY